MDTQLDPSALRRKAEKKLKERKTITEGMPDAEIQRMVHELEVHQIELEMQNDELRRLHDVVEESRKRYADLYDFAPVGYVTLDERGVIVSANLAAAAELGAELTRVLQKPFAVYVQPESRQTFRSHLKCVLETGELQTCEIGIKGRNDGTLCVQLQSVADRTGEEAARTCRTTLMDITARKQAERELIELRDVLAARVKELEEASAHIRALQGILPICMYCHRIRDDQECWQQLEQYVQEHSDAHFSHSLCPDCLAKYYAERDGGAAPAASEADREREGAGGR